MNRLSVRLLAAMLLVAVVSLAAVPLAQLLAERATIAGLPSGFRERVTVRIGPAFGSRPPRGAVGERPFGEPRDPTEENTRLFVLFADLQAARRQAALAAGGGALLLCVALALWLSRSIAGPIEAVSRAASALAAGSRGARVELARPLLLPREAQALAADFNAMAASLERLEGERRAMIADIAHELRNPLATLSMRLEALSDGLVTLDVGEVELLREQAALLTRLVEDLRVLSLADARRLQLRLEALDLRHSAAEVVAAYRAAADRRGVQLELHTPDAPVRVRADRHRLQQVLHNLLENAVRVSPAGGRVTVAVSEGPNGARVQVRDSGPGIAEQDLAAIFERFVQGRRRDTRDARAAGGSGLGLAIVRTLVDLHGGRVAARNRDRSAEFTVLLPLAPAEADEPDDPTPPAETPEAVRDLEPRDEPRDGGGAPPAGKD